MCQLQVQYYDCPRNHLSKSYLRLCSDRALTYYTEWLKPQNCPYMADDPKFEPLDEDPCIECDRDRAARSENKLLKSDPARKWLPAARSAILNDYVIVDLRNELNIISKEDMACYFVGGATPDMDPARLDEPEPGNAISAARVARSIQYYMSLDHTVVALEESPYAVLGIWRQDFLCTHSDPKLLRSVEDDEPTPDVLFADLFHVYPIDQGGRAAAQAVARGSQAVIVFPESDEEAKIIVMKDEQDEMEEKFDEILSNVISGTRDDNGDDDEEEEEEEEEEGGGGGGGGGNGDGDEEPESPKKKALHEGVFHPDHNNDSSTKMSH